MIAINVKRQNISNRLFIEVIFLQFYPTRKHLWCLLQCK